jgi:hypothetical protein
VVAPLAAATRSPLISIWAISGPADVTVEP